MKCYLGECGIEELKECLGDFDVLMIEGMIWIWIEVMFDCFVVLFVVGFFVEV